MQRQIRWMTGALSAVFAASTASATVTLTQDDRQVEIFVDATDLGGSSVVSPTPITPAFGSPLNSGFDSGNILSPLASASGRAISSQVSSFDASPSFMSVSASGASSGIIDADFDVNDVSISAESTFDITFSISTAMTYTLMGSVVDESSGSTGRVRLRPVGGNNIFSQTTTGSFNDSQLLQPGDYELIAEADVIGFVRGGGFFSRDASFDLTFTLVPEPASGILLLIGAGLLTHRRRRS